MTWDWLKDVFAVHRQIIAPLLIYAVGFGIKLLVSRFSREESWRLGADWAFLGFAICVGLLVDGTSAVRARLTGEDVLFGGFFYFLLPLALFVVSYVLFARARDHLHTEQRGWQRIRTRLQVFGSDLIGWLCLLHAWSAALPVAGKSLRIGG